MAKISHFVVTYNHETKEWELDSDAVQLLGGTVFDTVSGEWTNPEEQSEEHVIDTQATNILYYAIIGLEEPNG